MRDNWRYLIRYALKDRAGKVVEASVTVDGKKRRDEVMALIERVGYVLLSCEGRRREIA